MISLTDRRFARQFAHLKKKPAEYDGGKLLCDERREKLKHRRLRAEHRHLHMTAELRGKATGRRKLTELEPELRRLVDERRVGPLRNGKVGPLPAACLMKCGKPDCSHAQTRAWLRMRDAYAAKNYDLCHRAAAKQWLRNQHLEKEAVPCLFCPGRGCARCRGKGQYKCQPDLERLAYAGLLEAIRLFDPEKAGCISSYAVHTMKFQMLTLLRQTPVFYPQDLLRDRRAVAKLRKALGREPTEAEAEAALTGKDVPERARLALNCYYGNERKSVEELHETHVQRTSREERRSRRGRGSTVVEALSCSQPNVAADDSDEVGELRAALALLPVEHRQEVELHLRGRGAVSSQALSSLREAML